MSSDEESEIREIVREEIQTYFQAKEAQNVKPTLTHSQAVSVCAEITNMHPCQNGCTGICKLK